MSEDRNRSENETKAINSPKVAKDVMEFGAREITTENYMIKNEILDKSPILNKNNKVNGIFNREKKVNIDDIFE